MSRLQTHIELASLNSWRVGGTAEYYLKPASKSDLLQFFSDEQPFLRELPITWLGLGSNVLIADEGIPGLVVHLLGGCGDLQLTESGLVYAEAGVTSAKLARFAAHHHRTGAEFLAGIPGTVGGALAMNAGAWGGTTWSFVEQVECLNLEEATAKVVIRSPAEFDIQYRHCKGPQREWFLGAYFNFPRGDAKEAQTRIRALIQQRQMTQPIGHPSCGSVFKNPPGDHAARLIDQCGLKGTAIGGACISEKHANFIINQNKAKATDIRALIQLIQTRVQAKFGILLEPEVRFIPPYEPSPENSR